MLYEIVYFLGIGLIGGILAGLFGVGGGFIFIPAQLLIYSYFDVPREIQIKFAIGTSLAAIVFSTIASSYAHHLKGAIYFPIIRKIIIGIVLGTILGAYLATIFPSHILEIVFGCFECLFGLYFVVSPPVPDSSSIRNIPMLPLNMVIMTTSALAVLLGVGGGIFVVPLLTLLHLPLRKAIGSASLATLIVAFIGAITMLLPSLKSVSIYGAVGCLYLPAFIPLSLGALATAPLGVKLAHNLPTAQLKKVFGVLLMILGVIILVR